MNDVVILGCGLHRFGRHPDKTVQAMGRVAIKEALDEANVSFKDIQVAYTGRVYSGMGAGLGVVNELGQLGIPVLNMEMACASSSTAFIQARHVVASGIYDVALVVGFEQMQRGLIQIAEETSYGTQMGFNVMPASYALQERRYISDHGATEEMFAQVSVKSHENGALNPNAQYQHAVTLEEVMASRYIAEPIHLLECSPTTDGASAIVIANRSVAERFKPASELVTVAGWAQGSGAYVPHGTSAEAGDEGEGELNADSLAELARAAYERAGIGPQDVHVTQVHDAFAPGEIFSIESLGLVEEGKGAAAVWEGRTEISGDIPVNTDGGLISRGHPVGATGGAMITEIHRQLSGQAGARQVDGDPQTGLIHNAGIGGMNVLVLKH
ncbi:MAG TPA: thiolase family protein [Dehalococcoidia bacterium]|nr:thiolase family protein [Dehalococcoidia bacterium]